MSYSTIDLSLKLGKLVPEAAPAMIMEALKSVTVTQQDKGPCTFQMSFNADRTGKFSDDYPIISSPLLKATNRVIISVIIDSQEKVLMDGFITNVELSHSSSSGSATLSITGEDVSVMMDLMELSFEYPAMGPELIVGAVLAKYVAIGVVPTVIPPTASIVSDPLEQVPQQNDTDRNYLNWLASQYGYVFRVRPGSPMTNYAYWGPLIHVGLPQKVLNVNLGPATNVEDINFTYDAMQPTLVHGMLQDNEPLEEDIPVVTLQAIRLQPMAENDGLTSNQPFVKNTLFTDPRLGSIGGLLEAQMTTNRSTDQVVSGQATIDTLRYGSVVETPGVIPVRGAGHSYDGNYYVSQVTHAISEGSYKQNIGIQREGVGSLVTNVGEFI